MRGGGQGRLAHLSRETVRWLKVWLEHAEISAGAVFGRLIGVAAREYVYVDHHARIARMPIGRFIWDSGRRTTLFEQLKKSDFREDIFAAGFGQKSGRLLELFEANIEFTRSAAGIWSWQYPAPRGLLSFAQAPARPPTSVRLGPRTFTLTLPKGVPHCNVRFMPTHGFGELPRYQYLVGPMP